MDPLSITGACVSLISTVGKLSLEISTRLWLAFEARIVT